MNSQKIDVYLGVGGAFAGFDMLKVAWRRIGVDINLLLSIKEEGGV